MMHRTIFECEIEIDDHEFIYQQQLTKSLDFGGKDFDQDIINEIVLWKVNRYALIEKSSIFQSLNSIQTTERHLNHELTFNLLRELLNTKGIRLSMASTILRFKNPHIYQIIDQRVYRMIYKEPLKLPREIDKQIQLYLSFLVKLKEVCVLFKIKFEKADRILYMADKRINRGVKIKY